ncbi:hypothetical protein ET445_02180 [Agromyces protaetiae]|uniref:OmpR/PhoB-type domain-containing protein n=1 Tax=Agromyces protaetiae TaxID=2509455 RepID=A0A4V0YGT4_9MICO|nr:BTAD domain-containing putative transcriptional regulator [Agromyces protaetiae]QAY72321.1 hypothetical protein ET445_02180 [Agromyces protaetiae]
MSTAFARESAGSQVRPARTAHPSVGLLGPLEVHADGLAVSPQVGRVSALLALLALSPGRVVSADRLMAQLWDDEPPQSGVAALYVYVSRLRRQLEPLGVRVVTQAPGYFLDVRPDRIDLVRFADAVRRAEHACGEESWAEATAAVEAARVLWRGEPFAGLPTCDELVVEGRRLARARRRIDELEARVLLGIGDAGRAAARARTLTEAEPLDEGYWELRMRAEHAAGNTAIALSLFDEFRELLVDALGIDPGPRVRDLHTWILRDADADADAGRDGAATGSADANSATDPVTVGRTAQRVEIDRMLRDVREGRGHVVVFEGGAGVGKTHLAELAARSAARAGIDVVWARSVDGAGVPPLWIWRQLLGALPGAEASGAAQLDELRDRVTDGGADLGDAARFELSDAIVSRVLAAAAANPILLVVDDLQWVDSASLHALRLLAARTRETPCGLVVTARQPESQRTEVASLLTAFAREDASSRLLLAPFSVDEVAELIDAHETHAADRAAATADTLRARAERLAERTGGNAFFVTTLLAQGADGPLPASIAELFTGRLESLEPPVRRLVDLAAVGGQSLDRPALAAATSLAGHELLDALESAERVGVLRAADTGWTFSHSLARDAVLDAMTASQRILAHAAYADALERAHVVDADSVLEELAHHRYEAAAGVPERAAFEACTEAADRARSTLAFDRAARFRERALAMLPADADPGARIDVLLRLTEEQREAGDVQAAAQSLRATLRQAQRLGDRAATVRALSLLGGVTLWNWRQLGEVDRETIDLFDGVIDDPETTDAERADLHCALAMELYYGDDDDRHRGVEAAHRAIEHAAASGDPAVLARASSSRVFTLWRPGGEGARLAVLDRWLGLRGDARGPGDRVPGEIVARLHRASIRLSTGDIAGFAEDSERAGELIPRLGRTEFEAQHAGQLACAAMLEGRFNDARALIDRTYDRLRRTSIWGGEWGRAIQTLTLARLEGDVAFVADRIVAKASEDAHRTLRWAAVLALAEAGAEHEARAMQSRWNLRRVPVFPYWGSDFDRAQAAAVAVRLGTPLLTDAYTALAETTAPLVVAGTALACWGPRDRLLADIAERLGWDDRAAEHRRAADRLTRDVVERSGISLRW